ncbi:MAG TPA: HEPN domain-containing protein [Candidatus Dormibacteraeota bacterium]|nr:HEPN domain-containing protein [Candidatus Dormibacteraeota bacterium]
MPSERDSGYLAAANERSTDARRLFDTGRHCGAIYMAGYAVECRLKALLEGLGRNFPRAGASGHDLYRLWEAAGFRLQDLKGYRRDFVMTWSTDLRYQPDLPKGANADVLYKGAIELCGYLQTRLRNLRRPVRGPRGASFAGNP